ncbi:MAG: hypothetical protein J5I98_32025 [Phaeodactylibacter sp.]|nr:hypothetical protein [Phaeodactylibacter sp.]
MKAGKADWKECPFSAGNHLPYPGMNSSPLKYQQRCAQQPPATLAVRKEGNVVLTCCFISPFPDKSSNFRAPFGFFEIKFGRAFFILTFKDLKNQP